MTPKVPGQPPELPRLATPSASTAWAGMILLLAIEGTVIATLIASYFYLRVHAEQWPIGGIEIPDLGLPLAAYLVLLASALPVWFTDRRLRRGDRRMVLRALPFGVLLALGYLALTGMDLASKDYTWATNAYGSLEWTISGYTILHLVALILFACVVMAITARGHLVERRHIAVHVLALYWYFVAIAGIPVFVTLYLSPRLI